MQIEITNIRDTGSISCKDDTASKLILMDEILQIFTPLFSREIDRKQQQLESNKRDYRELREKVGQTKNQLQDLDQELRREKLIKSILKEMKTLIDHDVLYGNSKQVVTEIFQSLGDASRQDLEKRLNHLRGMVRKALAK
jgi:seryl-tRNA synthetase